MPDEIGALWEEAVARYNNALGKKGFSVPQPRSITELLDLVEDEHKKFAAWREKGARLRKLVHYALSPVETIGSIASSPTSLAFPPTQVIFGAVVHLIDTARNVSAAYDGIADLFDKLQSFTVRVKLHTQQDVSSEMREILVEILSTLLDILALSAQRMSDGRFRKYLDCALLGRDQRIDDAVARLDRLTNSELLMTVTETLSQVRLSAKTLGHVEQNSAETRWMIQDMRNNTLNHRSEIVSEQIRSLLKPEVATFEVFEKTKDELLENSGFWLLDEAAFRSWINEQVPLLFISGAPGAGKSFLACRIIEMVKEQRPEGLRKPFMRSIAYFFFRKDTSGLRSHRSAITTISYQLAKNDPVYAKYVSSLRVFIQDCGSIARLWERLIVDFYSRDNCQSKAIIILDGVDEAHEDGRELFLKLMTVMHALQKNGSVNLLIIATGRPEIIPEFENTLGFIPPKLDIDSLKNSKDIKRYIENTVAQSRSIRRRPKALRDEIVDKLTKGANGFFLWASLMLQEIEKAPRPDVIKRILNHPPKTLTGLLQDTVKRYSETLQPEEIEDLNHILAWVLHARRPLYLRELGDSLRIRSQEGMEVYDLEAKINKYATFFTLTNARGGPVRGFETLNLGTIHGASQDIHVIPAIGQPPNQKGIGSDNGTNKDRDGGELADYPKLKVSVRHASIADFLTNKDQSPTSAIGTSTNTAQLQILLTCLNVYADEELYETCSREDGLTRYARLTFEHLPLIDPSDVRQGEKLEVVRLLVSWFRDEKIVGRWAKTSRGKIREYLLEQSAFIAALHKWYADGDVQRHYEKQDPEVLAWLKLMLESPLKVQLRPVAMLCARNWLLVDNWRYEPELAFLMRYLELTDERFQKSWSNDPKNAGPLVLEVARWAKFAETPEWCVRVGFAVSKNGAYYLAIDLFEMALQGSEGDGIALCQMAVCYSKVGYYKKAIDLIKLGISRLSKAQAYMRDWAYWGLIRFQADIGDIQGVLEGGADLTREMEFSTSRNAVPYYLASYLACLLKFKQYKEAINIMERAMSFRFSAQFFRSLMDNMLVNLYLGHLAYAEDCTDFIGKFYERGLQVLIAADDDRDPDDITLQSIFRISYAIVLMRAGPDDDKAAEIFEIASKDLEPMHTAWVSRWMTEDARPELSMYYLRQATRAKQANDEDEVKKYALKLSGLAYRDSSQTYIPGSLLLYAAWRRLETPEADHKELLRPAMTTAINMLTDNTSENDEEGWGRLLLILSASGDLDNAIAASFYKRQFSEMIDLQKNKSLEIQGNSSSVATKINQESKNSKDESQGVRELRKDYKWGWCDGCLEGLSTRSLHYHCTHCLLHDLCEKCHGLLLQDKLEQNICDKSHKIVCISPVIKPLPPGKIRLKDDEILIEDWLAGLKQSWAIEGT
ncbi:MAG: hypothetical protein M1820_005976 [Bogoriella megaspora]|nr:MAG: hypothetical protein M1820_005976 [Bogoriella megaspora]